MEILCHYNSKPVLSQLGLKGPGGTLCGSSHSGSLLEDFIDMTQLGVERASPGAHGESVVMAAYVVPRFSWCHHSTSLCNKIDTESQKGNICVALLW